MPCDAGVVTLGTSPIVKYHVLGQQRKEQKQFEGEETTCITVNDEDAYRIANVSIEALAVDLMMFIIFSPQLPESLG